MRTLWSIFWSQKVSLAVTVIQIEAVMLLFVGWYVLAVLYGLAGAVIGWTFGSSAVRG